ncbi:MAG: hypothetical protein ACTSUV_04480 [Candidatus Ranarchaeia archaeon]
MIDEIFLIHNDGVPLLSWKYQGKMVNQDIISGFLSALQMFAGSTHGQKLHVVAMEPSLMVFEQRPNFTVVVTVQNRSGLNLTEKLIQVLVPMFEQKYHDLLENFSGDVTPFRDFAEILKMIIAECGIPHVSNFLKQKKKAKKEENYLLTQTVFDRLNGEIIYRNGGIPSLKEQVQFLFTNAIKSTDFVLKALCSNEITNIEIMSVNRSCSTLQRLSYVDVSSGKDLRKSSINNFDTTVKVKKEEILKDILSPKIDINLNFEHRKVVKEILFENLMNLSIDDSGLIRLFGVIDLEGGVSLIENDSIIANRWMSSIVHLLRCWKSFEIVSNQIHKTKLSCVEFSSKSNRYLLISLGELAVFCELVKDHSSFKESTNKILKAIRKLIVTSSKTKSGVTIHNGN